MRIPGLKSFRLGTRWLRSRFTGGALILGYHHIGEAVQDPYAVCVTPQHFSEQIEVCCRVARVISLPDLVKALTERRVPKRTVILTLDDGYVDALLHAKPVLERHQVPATVFVTTGSLGREFWWDELERVLLLSVDLPEPLSLEVRDDGYQWVVGNSRQRPTAGTRSAIIQLLHRSLLPLSPEDRGRAIAQLSAWLGMAPDHRSARRALTDNELTDLAAGGLIDIGAHTVTHPVLADLDISVQRSEIQGSKAHLEKLLARPVTSFSYPNGSLTQETLTIVQHAGFDCACGSYNDVVWRGSNRFHLPRFWVPDWDGERFSRWLRLWLHE